MAQIWPNLDLKADQHDGPFELVDKFKGFYQEIFFHTTNHPTASAPADYVMNLMFHANKIITLLMDEAYISEIRDHAREQQKALPMPQPRAREPAPRPTPHMPSALVPALAPESESLPEQTSSHLPPAPAAAAAPPPPQPKSISQKKKAPLAQDPEAATGRVPEVA